MARLVRAVIAFRAIKTIDAALLLRSIELYETYRVDFAAACLAASAEVTGVNEIVSFDRSLDRIGTISRIEP